MTDDKPPLTLVPPSEPSDGDAFERQQSDKVVRLKTITSLDLDPNIVLQAAIDADLDGVVVIGYTKGDPKTRNSKDEYFASSIAAGDTCVWLMQRSIHKMMHIADEEWDGNNEPSSGA